MDFKLYSMLKKYVDKILENLNVHPEIIIEQVKKNLKWTDIKNKPSITWGTSYDNTSIVVGSLSGEDANTASQPYSFAEGQGTTASGLYAHAEGKNTTAEGHGSHAEGSGAKALGIRSHAEGLDTVASGHNSHAEGDNTIARGQSQHVQGVGNLDDTKGEFLHIIGNGWRDEEGNLHRANAHTVDWYGNAWYVGDVRVGYGHLKLINEQEYNTKATKVPIKVIKDSDTGAWTPTLDSTNVDAQDEIVIVEGQTIEFSLPEDIGLSFSIKSNDDINPVTFIVKEGDLDITQGGMTLPPNYPLDFTKGTEPRSYTVSVVSGQLKIFNLFKEMAGLITPGGDVNLIDGVITLKDEVKESLGGPKVVTRTGTSITGEELLLCNTKYHYTEPINTMYLHYDMFKGSGENGAFQLGDEWDITFKIVEDFSFGYEIWFDLDDTIPSFGSAYPWYILHLKYVEDGENYQRRFIASFQKYGTSPVE